MSVTDIHTYRRTAQKYNGDYILMCIGSNVVFDVDNQFGDTHVYSTLVQENKNFQEKKI